MTTQEQTTKTLCHACDEPIPAVDSPDYDWFANKPHYAGRCVAADDDSASASVLTVKVPREKKEKPKIDCWSGDGGKTAGRFCPGKDGKVNGVLKRLAGQAAKPATDDDLAIGEYIVGRMAMEQTPDDWHLVHHYTAKDVKEIVASYKEAMADAEAAAE